MIEGISPISNNDFDAEEILEDKFTDDNVVGIVGVDAVAGKACGPFESIKFVIDIAFWRFPGRKGVEEVPFGVL